MAGRCLDGRRHLGRVRSRGLVDGVLAWLSERGFEDVEIVKAAEESITFSLPKELRRDLRAEAAALAGE